MIAQYVADTSFGTDYARTPGAMIIQHHPSQFPLSKILEHGDIVLLLTPVVLPVDEHSGRDPFEQLGRGLARYHPWVRHVPYTARGGITSTHVAFIRRAKAVVFVISGPPGPGQPSQVDLSNITQAIGEQRAAHVVVACCDVQDLESPLTSIPTIVQIPGYSLHELETAADLLFLGQSTRSALSPGPLIPPAKDLTHRWGVQPWNEARDLPAVYELWRQCMPAQFSLSQASLMGLLHRDGYAKHFVVRGPETGDILGFCATYITYLDSKGDILVGSLAALFVKAPYRGQGIGSILHDEALRGFTKTRGVSRLQLGSTFPRLLYGLPVDHPSEEWFRRRGWKMDCTAPGTGQEACDWLLAFDEWHTGGFPLTGSEFRPCGYADFDRVLEMVEQESGRNGSMAWYDQYAKLAETTSISDIIIGIRGGTIVAAAITYTFGSDNSSAGDIPWAGTISGDTGGVTCICITDEDSAGRDSLMIRLLDAGVQTLRQRGMNRMYIDAVKGGNAGFRSIGFQEWARYREVWRDTE